MISKPFIFNNEVKTQTWPHWQTWNNWAANCPFTLGPFTSVLILSSFTWFGRKSYIHKLQTVWHAVRCFQWNWLSIYLTTQPGQKVRRGGVTLKCKAYFFNVNIKKNLIENTGLHVLLKRQDKESFMQI